MDRGLPETSTHWPHIEVLESMGSGSKSVWQRGQSGPLMTVEPLASYGLSGSQFPCVWNSGSASTHPGL